MSPTHRSWVAVPGWWIPVWVIIDGDAQALDPLEEAVRDLIAADYREVAGIARRLGLPIELVDSAVGTLFGRRVIADEEGGLRVLGDRSDAAAEEPATRSGWLGWVHGPVFELVLAEEPPDPPEALPGWTFHPLPHTARRGRKPTDGQIDDVLRVLPSTGRLRASDLAGARIEEIDGSRVRRVRRKSEATLVAAPLWCPVEHRITGPVVWRPSMVPSASPTSELDPGGWEGLAAALAEEVVAELNREGAGVLEHVAPGVLRDAGYESVQELRESAERKARHQLGIAGDAMSDMVNAVAQAYILETLAGAMGLDWRALARGWADVVEVATVELKRAIGELPKELPAAATLEVQHEVRYLLGPRWFGFECEDRSALRKLLANEKESVGHRLAAIRLALLEDAKLRRRAKEANTECSHFLRDLERAKDQRNLVAHRRGDGTEVDVKELRALVLNAAKGIVRMLS
jgi:hypothetical protein